MLINLRNALMSGKRLPYDAEVEYLESTGTQWIDTGIAHDQTFRWECDAEFTSIGSVNQYIGQSYKTAAGDVAPRFTFGSSGARKWYAGLGNLNGSGLETADTDRHVFILDALQKTFQVDDNTYAVKWSSFSLPTYVGCGLGLFGRSFLDTDGEVSPFCSMRIYSSKHYQNGNLVRDYIPVRKGTVGYLYDRVSGKLFGNAGTGDFVLGPDVVPVEYIQVAVSAARIITGVPLDSALLSQGVNIDLDMAFPNPGNNLGLLAQGTALTTSPWTLSGGSSQGVVKLFAYGNFNYSFDGVALKTNILIEVSTSSVFATVNGVRRGGGYSQSLSYGQRLVLLGYDSNSNSAPVGTRIYGYKMESNGLAKEHLFPIRVGTDATSWEGAMMDVLTRRIYRNAGTGAFTYGNDLKYPIPAE